MSPLFRSTVLMFLVGFLAAAAPTTRENAFKRRETPPPIVGRWDVSARDAADGEYPSWFEVEQSGYRTLVGRYVGKTGSARPIARVDFDDATGKFRFAVPPQWERRHDDVVLEGKLEGDTIRGRTTDIKGKPVSFEARRAPSLNRDGAVTWSDPIELFNGRDLTGWKTRWSEKPNGWVVRDGLLANAKPGNDLLTIGRVSLLRGADVFAFPQTVVEIHHRH